MTGFLYIGLGLIAVALLGLWVSRMMADDFQKWTDIDLQSAKEKQARAVSGEAGAWAEVTNAEMAALLAEYKREEATNGL